MALIYMLVGLFEQRRCPTDLIKVPFELNSKEKPLYIFNSMGYFHGGYVCKFLALYG